MAFPHLMINEGLDPHTVSRLYLFWSDRANTWVDVTGTLDTKIAALREHASQIREPEALEERIRTWATEEAGRFGVDAVESFRVVDVA